MIFGEAAEIRHKNMKYIIFINCLFVFILVEQNVILTLNYYLI